MILLFVSVVEIGNGFIGGCVCNCLMLVSGWLVLVVSMSVVVLLYMWFW